MTQTPSRPKIELPEIEENLITFSEAEVTPNQNLIVEKKPLPPLINGFYNLPIWSKQITVLLLTQVISIGALLGVGVNEIIKTGRKQLVNQSQSELAATRINYNLKVDQMGFGFRGQSDNAAVIEAALLHANGKNLTPEKRTQLKNILVNEIQARKIEYATLVGKDKRIIVNGNKNRAGELFDPNQLVSKVMNNPEQIKTSELVSATELSQESPPILPLLNQEEFYLIRYTLTPVKNPNNGQVIGVLVSGDLIDAKNTIPQITLNEFGGGYSGIYKINPDGSFNLASSLTEEINNKNQPLTDTNFLFPILTNPEAIVNSRSLINDNDYTITGQAVLNNDNKPVGVLVRGTPEMSLAQILSSSLTLQGRVALITVLINLLLAFLLGKVIADRVEKLQEVTKEFARGNQDIRANIQGQDEIGSLGAIFNEMADNIEFKDSILHLNAENADLLQEITSSSTTSENDLNNIFNKALNKARLLLALDRIVVYRFQADGGGYIANESRDAQFPLAINEKIEDACIPTELRDAYLKGRIMATEDVFNAGFAPEHLALMYRLNIKANLVVPILNQGQLFGLLIAHDCQQTRQWQEREKTFLKEMAIRFGVVLDRFSLLQNQMGAATRSEQLKDITIALSSGLNRTEVFKIAVEKTRMAIVSDRVIVYEFDQNWQGTIIAESVLAGYPEALDKQILDPCFAEGYVEKYQQGRVQAIPNIYEAGLTPCHLQQLEPFAVKANLVAPILEAGNLKGLLIAHQCSDVRYWQPEEIELFSQLSTQLGLALERVDLVQAQQLSEKQQRQAKEILQKRALELLMQVDSISRGDLTIRAQVTNDEIGTIADSYNATVESLSKIVSQVQSVALEVTNTTNTNESDLNILQGNIQDQKENIALALERIEAMSQSSSMVAENAQQAQGSLKKAQATVEKGDRTMNRTVKSILNVRSAVQDASSQVQKLGEATEKIANVVGLISRFAAQTHLLALKASIEAARAGEEGKGFAVIADEVRTLATQSAEATADIEDLVAKIQSETNAVVTAMEEGTQQVSEGTKLVEETREGLNQITEATIQINQLVELIASSALEQNENSQEVTAKMSNVANVAEKTTVSVGKLSDSFGQLLAVAKQLESNVSKFKIS